MVLFTVKASLLVAVPPAVVTETLCRPFAAPLGTVAVTEVALLTVIDATETETEPNLISVVLVNPVPVNVTESPRIPEVTLSEVIVGTGTMVKVLSVFEVPPAFVTTTAEAAPSVSPAGTVTTTEVLDAEVTVAEIPPMDTVGFEPDCGFRPVPVIVIESPALPDVELSDETTGAE